MKRTGSCTHHPPQNAPIRAPKHHVSCGLSLSEVFQRDAFAGPAVSFPEDVGSIGARALGQHEPADQAS